MTFPSGDISKDPNYKGGYVGFAFIGDPQKCPQNKYSMYEHNQRNSSGTPWVTTLIYHSTVDPGGFYMAFEDLPMSADGLEDRGRRQIRRRRRLQRLRVLRLGSDLRGRQSCRATPGCKAPAPSATPIARAKARPPVCRPVIQKGPEICDNVDNDCDGVIDNGDGLCTGDKPICFQGQCVGTCNNGEFQCPIGLSCDDFGHCADPVCASVNCMPGTACRAGKCVDPCDGVTCPYPQACQLGQCVDPCAGVTCPADRVCEKGLCLSKCDCRGCDTGLTCAADGRCIDTACANKMCETGTVCRMGACVDPCDGVTCPNGGVCSQGTCSAPMGNTGTGATGTGAGTSVDFGGGSSTGLDFGGSSNGTGAGTVRTVPGRNTADVTAKGCGCRVGGDTDPTSTKLAWLGALLGLGLVLNRRRSLRVPRV